MCSGSMVRQLGQIKGKGRQLLVHCGLELVSVGAWESIHGPIKTCNCPFDH